MLRENLKRMSDNVNILIEKMNSEQQKKKKVVNNPDYDVPNQHSPSAKSRHGATSVGDVSINANTDKAITNLMREHAKLKKRLEII